MTDAFELPNFVIAQIAFVWFVSIWSGFSLIVYIDGQACFVITSSVVV
jgi:hypothetical protein